MGDRSYDVGAEYSDGDVVEGPPHEWRGLQCVSVRRGGSTDEGGSFHVYCVYSDERNEWIGIVKRAGYFDSIRHLDIIWDPDSPCALNDRYAKRILEAYQVGSGVSLDKVLSIPPSELEKLSSEKTQPTGRGP